MEDIMDLLGRGDMDIISLDATSLACKTGNPVAMNTVMLGAMCAGDFLPITRKSVIEAIGARTPKHMRETNLAAFDMGFDEVKKTRK
jgi:Pyruvate/2-oxoacid:ferredoxin oxidoreductase gamma subunit